jgi:serine phosphatase RsbU (regulator of sigma subunit)
VNRKLQLDAGDSLILFTDGVSEARNAADADLGSNLPLGSMHGASAELIARAVNEAVIAHVGAAENLEDDVTLVIVSRST